MTGGDSLSLDNGVGAIQLPNCTHCEVSDVHISGDSTLPGNTRFTITSTSLTTNVLTVNYSGSPSPAPVVGQYISIIGITTDPTLNIELPVASVGAGTFTMSYTHPNVGSISSQGTWSYAPKYGISSIQRTTNVTTVTCTTAATCNAFTVGQNVIVEDVSGDTTMNGYQVIASVPGTGTYTYANPGSNAGPFVTQGETLAANQQYGIIITGTSTDIKILRNYIQNLTFAIGCGTSGSDNINGCLVDGNHLFNIVGRATGTGYGILGQTNSFGGYRIVNNFEECVQRHDVYTGAGQGHVIANNYSSRHGCDAPAGGEVMAIGRQSDTTVTANNISRAYSNGINIFAGASVGSLGQVNTRNIAIVGNTFDNTYGNNYAAGANLDDIVITAENNAVDVPHDVNIIGNQSRRTQVAGFSTFVGIVYGIGINIVDNDCSYDSFGSQQAMCFTIFGSGESAGTATYSDHIDLSSNRMRISGSSQDDAIYIASTAATSGINIDLLNNDINSTNAVFFAATQTDPNVQLINNPVGNMTVFQTTNVGAPQFFGKSKFAAATTSYPSYNLPSGTAPTSPAAGDVWTDTNEEKHVVQTATSGAIKFYDSGGTNAITHTTSGTITSYTVNHPLAAATGVLTGVNASNVITWAHSGDAAHSISQLAKTAAVTTFTLCAATANTACGQAGQYRISYNFYGSGTACATVTAGSVGLNLTWTDTNAVTHTTISLPLWDQKSAAMTNGLFNFNTALGTEGASGSYIISTNGTIIQAATTYTACTSGTGAYNLKMTVEQLQ
jgi:hypothetical protein